MKSKLSKSARNLVLLSGLLCAYQVNGFSQQAPAADNTKSNSQASQTTADQQSNSPSDRELTQSVRKAIMSDKSLSTYAHNVKVVSQNGQVTLSGPVRSDEEKQAIVAKAAELAGKDKVVDELTIAPANH
jgi:hyperosmotically inducible periplasmic protein